MKRAAFDDPGAFRRRWSHLSPDQLHAESLRDPLVFAADHLPIEDRREGTVLVVAEVVGAATPVVVVIPDGPAAPAEEICLGVLARVIAQLDEVLSDTYLLEHDEMDDDLLDEQETTSVVRLGVVTHRLGPATIHESDRRWISALGLVAVSLGIATLGVVSRTRSGALVRVPESAAA
jgi:hypothetical protein